MIMLLLSTHAGSVLADCERLARSYYPDITILGGLAVWGTDSQNARPTGPHGVQNAVSLGADVTVFDITFSAR